VERAIGGVKVTYPAAVDSNYGIQAFI